MKHIISFSSGLSSALTGARVLEKYGKDNVLFVFMDTLVEDEDNYRFMDEWATKFDVEIIKLSDGRTPTDALKDAKMIGSQWGARCTLELKIKVFREWLKSIDDEVTVHIGYDYSEVERCEATTKSYEKLGYKVDYPLLWKPYEFRKYDVVSREDWGIEPPRMYAMGYAHANCGGMCVKAGKGDWTRTLINFPDRYKFMEDWELDMLDNVVAKKFTILRDFEKGENGKQITIPLTLKDHRLRQEIKKDEPTNLDFFDACVHCGIESIE